MSSHKLVLDKFNEPNKQALDTIYFDFYDQKEDCGKNHSSYHKNKRVLSSVNEDLQLRQPARLPTPRFASLILPIHSQFSR